MKTSSLVAAVLLVTACATDAPPHDTTANVACVRAADCPSTACEAATCERGACVVVPLTEGAIASAQVTGDCQLATCDGNGNVVEVADDDNVPAGSNACVVLGCAGGSATSSDAAAGAACGSGVCNGAGACVACLAADACPGSDTACAARTCLGGVCGVDYEPAGTVTTEPAATCQQIVCDGSGGTTTANLSFGTACTITSTPGEDIAGTCDGNGDCVAWNITKN